MGTILVTGATGFLGSALVEALLGSGCRVLGIGRRSKGFLSDAVFNSTRFTLLNLDLTKDFAAALSNHNIEVVFHLAARQPGASIGFDDFYAGNVETTRQVIQYAKQAGVAQLVYISTVAVYGKDPRVSMITEEDIPTPMNHYGLTKYMAERLIEIELFQSSTQSTVVRFPSLYGRNHLGGMLYTYYQVAKENKPIEVYGKGEVLRNALYVEDAVDILIRAVERKADLASFEIFLAGSANSLSMGRIAECVRDYLRSSSDIIAIDKPPSPAWDMELDIGKARQRLGFNPMTLEEGIKRYSEDMCQPL